MGIMNFVKNGVREMMIARPDALKHAIVYKHPDQNVPFWSQLTVDSDECALFFKDGQYMGWLPAGRHTLQTQNIPFLNNLVNKFTGGDVFIAEIFFVKTQPIRSLTFGGKLESMEDPILFEFVTPRLHGEFSMVVTDPVRFVIGFHGQCAGSTDPDETVDWIKRLLFASVKTVIGQMCTQSGRSLLNLGGMTDELRGRIIQNAPNLEDIGVKVLQIADFNINFSAEDQKLLREANKTRAEARRGVSIASDQARAKQFELDQQYGNDARYVQQLAGSYSNYAAGKAMMGAGEGMAQGGGDAGVAGLGAQMAVGVGMANALGGGMAAGQPQFAIGHGGQPGVAPGMGVGVPAAPGPAAKPTIAERLTKLTALKEQGLINEQEFNARRSEILAEI
jgi:membrane protease subunit (stomatin/prohibitin family)